jgi:hypothetical protein
MECEKVRTGSLARLKQPAKPGKKILNIQVRKALPLKSLVLFEEKNKLSISQINPVTTEASNRKNSKS